MSLTEFDEKEFIEMIRNESREEAHDEGFEEGQELLASLVRKLYADGRESEVLNAAVNKSFRDQLMKEYALI